LWAFISAANQRWKSPRLLNPGAIVGVSGTENPAGTVAGPGIEHGRPEKTPGTCLASGLEL
jgi:hypothetical protein